MRLLSHEYAGVTFVIHGARGEQGSVTVPAPERFYRRWAMWLAVWLWIWATDDAGLRASGGRKGG